MAPEKQHDVSHRDGGPGPLLTAVRDVAECNHPHGVACGGDDVPSGQQLPCQVPYVLGRAAAKTRQRDFEHHGIAHGGVEARGAFLDLPDNHVRPIRRAKKDRIWYERPAAERATPAAANDIVAGSCEAECKDIEISHRPGMVASVCLEHRILGNGEVPVDVEVCLHECD